MESDERKKAAVTKSEAKGQTCVTYSSCNCWFCCDYTHFCTSVIHFLSYNGCTLTLVLTLDGVPLAAASSVSVPQVARVLSEVYGDRMAAQSEGESFPLQQKLLVCCLLLLIRNGKSKEVPLGKLHEVHSRLCSQRQVGGVGQGECLSLCSLLESRGIFALKKAKEARLTKVSGYLS